MIPRALRRTAGAVRGEVARTWTIVRVSRTCGLTSLLTTRGLLAVVSTMLGACAYDRGYYDRTSYYAPPERTYYVPPERSYTYDPYEARVTPEAGDSGTASTGPGGPAGGTGGNAASTGSGPGPGSSSSSSSGSGGAGGSGSGGGSAEPEERFLE